MSERFARSPIRSLSGVLANQIAAGEVVERPASVVKELVENALDAHATRVEVELESGGSRMIRVRDDGFGIPSEELVLALSRHATSKIATLDDLDRITSMGFRGEALPSIGSVSRLTLHSRSMNSESGARVRVDGGAVSAVEPAASRIGTTVEVCDLFFNVPARRKFLRAPRTELRHAEGVLRRLALACPDVSFVLRHDARKAIEAPRRMEPERRLARLLGEEFARSALAFSFDAGDLSMHGFLAPPGVARARADLQYLFVNGRSVRDDVVRHAVRVGFGDLLAGAAYPAYVLHLNIEPAAVDVNVHPTKHEVRFREPRHIHDFVRHAVSRTLGESALSILPLAAPAGESESAAAPPAPFPGGMTRSGASRVADHAAAYYAPSPASPSLQGGAGRGRVRLGNYVLVEDRGKVLLIDLGAGRRALVRDRLNESSRTREPVSRPLLIPHTSTVPESAADAVDAAGASIRSLGLEVRRGAPGSITLRALPACLAGISPEMLLEAVSGWATNTDSVTSLVSTLAALAESSPFDGDTDDIIDAAIAGRLGGAAIAIDETVLRRVFANSVHR